jgi:hypothetical protein
MQGVLKRKGENEVYQKSRNVEKIKNLPPLGAC